MGAGAMFFSVRGSSLFLAVRISPVIRDVLSPPPTPPPHKTTLTVEPRPFPVLIPVPPLLLLACASSCLHPDCTVLSFP